MKSVYAKFYLTPLLAYLKKNRIFYRIQNWHLKNAKKFNIKIRNSRIYLENNLHNAIPSICRQKSGRIADRQFNQKI